MSQHTTSQTVTILGGHGRIALLTAPLLVRAGFRVVSVIRNPEHAADVAATGAEPLLLDLEHSTAAALAEAVPQTTVFVFAAGAGAGSGPARKETVDHQGAVTTLAAATSLGAAVVQISFQRVDGPLDTSLDETWQAYHRAKKAADDALRAGAAPYVIVRPGHLTDAPDAGVAVAAELPSSTTSRAAVASVLVASVQALVTSEGQLRREIDVIDGDADSTEATAAALA